MAPATKPLTITNGGALVPLKDKLVEYVPFQERDPIKLSVDIVRNYIATPTKKGVLPTDAQCMRFVMLCKARQLNPFAGDAYLVGYDGQNGPEFSLITAHQSLLKRAEVHPEYDGMESGVMVRRKVVDEKGEERSVTMDLEGDYFETGDEILGGWACVHFRTRRHPMRERVRLSTYNSGYSRWKADPGGMIVKVAEASCLRRAFPTVLGGMFLTEHGAAFEPASPVPLPRSDSSRSRCSPMQRIDLEAPEADDPTPAEVNEGLEREARTHELDQEIREADTLAACDRAAGHIMDAEDLIGHQAAMSLRTALATRRTALGLGDGE